MKLGPAVRLCYVIEQGVVVVQGLTDHGISHRPYCFVDEVPTDSTEFPEMVTAHGTNIDNMSVN